MEDEENLVLAFPDSGGGGAAAAAATATVAAAAEEEEEGTTTPHPISHCLAVDKENSNMENEEQDMKSIVVKSGSSNEWGEDLLEEIMKLIMAKLFYWDQLRFVGVCKRWREMKRSIPIPPPAIQFPCLLYKHSSSGFKLFDPVYQNTYALDSASLLKNLDGIRAWASKDGWFLMSDTNGDFFFYNPFTRHHLDLPWCDDSQTDCATFSSSPTTSACIVIAISCISHLFLNTVGCVYISMCRVGDTTWAKIKFACVLRHLRDPLYLDGILYCIYDQENVAAFNLTQNTWNSVARLKVPYFDNFRMVESRGELLLACFNCESPWETLVFKLVGQSERMTWLAVGSLGNRALLVTNTFSLSVEVSETPITIGGIEADGVYYTDFPYMRFLSLKDEYRSHVSEIYPALEENDLIVGYVEPPALHH